MSRKNPFTISKKIRSLLNKKEEEILLKGSSENIKKHSPHRLKQYIRLVTKLRQKYEDLTQRQKAAQRNTESLRTIEKAKIFENLLTAFKDQSEKRSEKQQAKLDHDQHYDLDGVTFNSGKVHIKQQT